MNEGKRVEIRELDLKAVADLCQAIFLYARGGDFRPVPQGDLLWLISELLGLGRFNGRFSFLPGWKKICWSHGLDPVSGERISQDAFESSVKELVAKNEHRHRIKEERRAKSKVEAEGSKGKPELASEVFTPLVASSDLGQPMLRQIQRRLISRYTNT
jgi:hypothetical protein